MTRTLIDTNDELLAQAQALLGTGTKKDTVNAALAQVVALDARRQFIDDARAGGLADDLDEPSGTTRGGGSPVPGRHKRVVAA